MAANKYTDPILQVFLMGRKKATEMTYEDNFAIKGKEEHTLVLVDTDLFKPISYTNIGTVSKIIMSITPLTTVQVDPIVTLRLTVDNTVDPVYTIELPCRKFFMYCPDPAFSGFITSMEVSTTSTEDVQIEFRIYGE
jgi:hypothetical protein